MEMEIMLSVVIRAQKDTTGCSLLRTDVST